VKNKADKKEEDILKIREQHAKEQEASEYVLFFTRTQLEHERHSRNSRKAQIEKMEAEVRKLQRRRNGSDDEDSIKKKPKKSYLNEELAKYSKVKGIHAKGKKRDEGDALAVLNSFRGKLQDTMSVDDVDMSGVQEKDGIVEEGMEVDNDFGF
jgi:peptidyl-prolyl cis-trans isomerase SDCCAG10